MTDAPAFRIGPRILLRVSGQLAPVRLERIIRFAASDGRVTAFLDDEQGVVAAPIRVSLNDLESALGDWFIRLQRAHLVNVEWIDRFNALEDGREEALLRDGSRVLASRAVSIELRRAAL